MAKKSPVDKKSLSIVLMVIGVGLALWGYQMSGSITSQFSQAFSGSPSDKVMIMYLLGATSFVAGLLMFRK